MARLLLRIVLVFLILLGDWAASREVGWRLGVAFGVGFILSKRFGQSLQVLLLLDLVCFGDLFTPFDQFALDQQPTICDGADEFRDKQVLVIDRQLLLGNEVKRCTDAIVNHTTITPERAFRWRVFGSITTGIDLLITRFHLHIGRLFLE